MLPDDRKMFGTEHDLEDVIRGESQKRSFSVATTGAKLTYRHAGEVLARFASSLVGKDFRVDMY